MDNTLRTTLFYYYQYFDTQSSWSKTEIFKKLQDQGISNSKTNCCHTPETRVSTTQIDIGGNVHLLVLVAKIANVSAFETQLSHAVRCSERFISIIVL